MLAHQGHLSFRSGTCGNNATVFVIGISPRERVEREKELLNEFLNTPYYKHIGYLI